MPQPITAEFLRKVLNSKPRTEDGYQFITYTSNGQAIKTTLEVLNIIKGDLAKTILSMGEVEKNNVANDLIAIEKAIKNNAGLRTIPNSRSRIMGLESGDIVVNFSYEMPSNSEEQDNILKAYIETVNKISKYEPNSHEFNRFMTEVRLERLLLDGSKPKQANLNIDINTGHRLNNIAASKHNDNFFKI